MGSISYEIPGTYTFTSSVLLSGVAIACWGAGGNGSPTGNGGSGGAWCTQTADLKSGSYTVVVGARNYDGFGNGGDSYFVSASVIICRAPGGKIDGTTNHQTALMTGSFKIKGGRGGAAGANSGGSGGCGGHFTGLSSAGDGTDGTDCGASFSAFGHPYTQSIGAVDNDSYKSCNGAYYFAGTAARIIKGVDAPDDDYYYYGCGGSGGYPGENSIPVDTTGRPGKALVSLNW